MPTAHQWSPPPPEPTDDTEAHSVSDGCHTDGGLTVADLIAKIGAPSPGRPSHRRAAPETEPTGSVPYQADPSVQVPQCDYGAYAVSTSSAYASELPDLEIAHRSRRSARAGPAEQTIVLPTTW
ncbi:MAG: hypothetical protein J2P16_04665, partial [Mycobacterium sp.]|nr:hypothetical protein [Mycobacterium sp.]